MSSQPASKSSRARASIWSHARSSRSSCAILLALFLFALDQTVVGTALPIISTDLNGAALYTWAFTIYLLTSTISGPIYGKLSDLYGRRPIFIWAVGLFLVAVDLRRPSPGDVAVHPGPRPAGPRRRRGLPDRASRSSPTSTRREERAKYGALFGAVFGLSSVLGPLLGGFVTDNFGWPWIFFLNVPLGLDLAVRLLAAAAADQAPREPAATSTTSARRCSRRRIGPFLLGLSNKQPARLDRPVGRRADRARPGRSAPSSCGGSAARSTRSSTSSLFRNRTVAISVAGMFLAAFGFFGAIVFLPQWFQVVAGAGRHRVGPQPPAAGLRADRRRRSLQRPDRGPDRPLQADDLRRRWSSSRSACSC